MKNREKLVKQLFVGKVSEILGFDKTLVLLKEANDAFEKCEHNEDNDPKAYADLILNGEPEKYLKAVTVYKPFES